MGTQSLIKQPSEVRTYTMDFGPNMAAAELITGVTVTASPSGLTLSSQAYSGRKASVKIAAGVTGGVYKVTFVATTDAGQTLESEGILNVEDL